MNLLSGSLSSWGAVRNQGSPTDKPTAFKGPGAILIHTQAS